MRYRQHLSNLKPRVDANFFVFGGTYSSSFFFLAFFSFFCITLNSILPLLPSFYTKAYFVPFTPTILVDRVVSSVISLFSCPVLPHHTAFINQSITLNRQTKHNY